MNYLHLLMSLMTLGLSGSFKTLDFLVSMNDLLVENIILVEDMNKDMDWEKRFKLLEIFNLPVALMSIDMATEHQDLASSLMIINTNQMGNISSTMLSQNQWIVLLDSQEGLTKDDMILEVDSAVQMLGMADLLQYDSQVYAVFINRTDITAKNLFEVR